MLNSSEWVPMMSEILETKTDKEEKKRLQNKERSRRFRERSKAADKVLVQVLVDQDDAQAVKDFAQKLNARRSK